MLKKELFISAKEAMQNSYAPYSKFNVGAALLTKNGKIFKGCNIENASYSVTVCAERVALFAAISNSEYEFDAICIVGGKDGIITDYAVPCGICRQALSEFCNEDFKIYVGISEDSIKEYSLGELIPHTFDKSKLGE